MTTILYARQKPYRGDGSGYQQEYEIEFEVQASDGFATNAQVTAATGATYGSAHPENSFALAYNAKPVQRDDVCFWDVVIKYRTFGFSAEQDDLFNVENPLNRRPVVTMGWQGVNVPVPTDSGGNLIKNTAGQVPDPRLESNAPQLLFNIKANVGGIPTWIDTYRNRFGGAINDAPFKIEFQNPDFYYTIAAGCARLDNVNLSDLKTENGIDFFEVSFSLLKKDPPPTDDSQDGWCFDMVDQGKMELNPAEGATTPPELTGVSRWRSIVGNDGHSVSEPTLLNGDGGAVGIPKTWNSSTTYNAADPNGDPATWGTVVINDDILYYAIGTNTNQEPPNATYWRPLPHVLYWDYLPRKQFAGILPACKVP